MRILIISILALLIVSCCTVTTTENSPRKLGPILSTYNGGEVFGIPKTGSTPDLYGSVNGCNCKASPGYYEVTYRGVTRDGKAMLSVNNDNTLPGSTWIVVNPYTERQVTIAGVLVYVIAADPTSLTFRLGS